jgi:D-methionine transport system ATP-binding protein
VITVEKVTKSFWSRPSPVLALHDVTLDVAMGTVTGVVGAAGSGKSTLLRCIALQERPDAGIIRLDGADTSRLDARGLRAARRLIGVVGATEPLVRQRTVAGNVALPLEQAGVDGPRRRAKVGQLLDLIGLVDKAGAHPGDLTEGQRLRVSIARSLVGEPLVLLADEPSAGLDADATAGVLTVLDRARAELGVTVLLATADASVARRACESVALLDDGRILEQGTLLSLVRDPNSQIAAAILPSVADTLSPTSYDRVAEVVLIGFAAVGALLPEAGTRFGVDIAVIGGGQTRIGETPIARFRIGLCGDRVDAALAWIADRGGVVHQRAAGPQGMAA